MKGGRDVVKVSGRDTDRAVRTEEARSAPDSSRAMLASAGGHIMSDGQVRAGYRKEVPSGGGVADSHAKPRSASFGVRSSAVEAKTTATAADPRSTGVVSPLLAEVPRSAHAGVATNFPVDVMGDAKIFGVSGHMNKANGVMYEYERKIRSSPVTKIGGDGDRIRDTAVMDGADAEPSTTAVQVIAQDPRNGQPSVSVGGAGTIERYLCERGDT